MIVTALIPMKLNNERLPGKNTKKFYNGTPLCNLVFDTVSSVKNINRIYCFCSDETIADYIPEGINYLKRSKNLDTQTATMNDVIRSFISIVDSDIYVLIHATSPFIKANTIFDCVEAVKTGKYDSALSVEPLHEFLWINEIPLNYNPEKIPRTQDLQTVYKETSGVYVFTKDLFLKHNRRVGFNPYFHEVGFIEGIDIDYPEDFDIADIIFENILNKE